jgi:hypothetical protein
MCVYTVSRLVIWNFICICGHTLMRTRAYIHDTHTNEHAYYTPIPEDVFFIDDLVSSTRTKPYKWFRPRHHTICMYVCVYIHIYTCESQSTLRIFFTCARLNNHTDRQTQTDRQTDTQAHECVLVHGMFFTQWIHTYKHTYHIPACAWGVFSRYVPDLLLPRGYHHKINRLEPLSFVYTHVCIFICTY